MAEDKDSKKHDPTPHKLDEERKKGNTLKVQDAMVAAILFVSAYALTWTGQMVYQYLFKFVIETIQTMKRPNPRIGLSDIRSNGRSRKREILVEAGVMPASFANLSDNPAKMTPMSS